MHLALSPGLLVGKRFRLDRAIGQGGMSCVWAATNTATSKPVALKFLKRPASPDSPRRRRFLQEARVTIDHPNVVRIYDCLDLTPETPFLVMELLHGQTLAEKIRCAGKLTSPEACAILRPVVSAVGCAHAQGIVHRDLKPENIFLSKTRDEVATIKVLDFGVAKLLPYDRRALDLPGLTKAGSVLGTVGYVAPEQACGGDVDHRADIWALGVLLYECLAGEKPFPSDGWVEYLTACLHGEVEDVRRRAPETPLAVAEMIHGMLSSDRSRRPDLSRVFDVLGAHCDAPSQAFDAPMSSLGPGEAQPLETLSDHDRAFLGAATEASAPAELSEPGGDGSTDDIHPVAAPSRPWASRWRLGVVASAVAAGLVLAFSTSRRPSDAATDIVRPSDGQDTYAPRLPPSQSSPAPTHVEPPTAPPASSSTNDLLPPFKIRVDPPDASVEIDGTPVRNRGGFVVISGKPDDAFRVRVTDGRDQQVTEVQVTRSGPIPRAIKLVPRAPERVVPRPVTKPSLAAPSAAAPPPPTTTPPPLPGIIMDVSEFRGGASRRLGGGV